METVKGIFITTNSDVEITTIENQIEDFNKLIGGYIECIYLPNEYVMIIDEEGKIKNKDINPLATDILRYAYETADFIVGNVFIVKQSGCDVRGLTYGEIKEFFDSYGLFKIKIDGKEVN